MGLIPGSSQQADVSLQVGHWGMGRQGADRCPASMPSQEHSRVGLSRGAA